MINEQIASKIVRLENANADLKAQNNQLINALQRAEQTIRNLGNGFLTGDGQVIALNEASNIRAAIAESEGK
jgi:hypothetical protein